MEQEEDGFVVRMSMSRNFFRKWSGIDQPRIFSISILKFLKCTAIPNISIPYLYVLLDTGTGRSWEFGLIRKNSRSNRWGSCVRECQYLSKKTSRIFLKINQLIRKEACREGSLFPPKSSHLIFYSRNVIETPISCVYVVRRDGIVTARASRFRVRPSLHQSPPTLHTNAAYLLCWLSHFAGRPKRNGIV
jgi:hypothetical protein